MKYLIACWCLIIILCCIFIGILVQLSSVLIPQPVHIFFEDYATTPAFLEMVEMVQLPPKEPKFFAFHRFPNRAKSVYLKSINATEIDISAHEGLYATQPDKFYVQLEKYLKKYKKNPLILYGNRTHFLKMYAPLLNKIDPARIQKIHLFEDGFGESGYYGYRNVSFTTDKTWYLTQLKECLSGNLSNEWKVNHGLHKIYPVVYHVAFKNILMSNMENAFSSIRKLWKDADVQNVSLADISKKLTTKQKQFLSDMIGFNQAEFLQKAKGKRVGILCTGHISDRTSFNYEIEALKEILKQSPKDVVWFLKFHPSYSASAQNEILKQEFPDLPLIQPQVPVELLLLTVPVDFVAGYRSSLFFSTPPDKIFKVIGLSNDPVIKGLVGVHQITEKQIQPLM